MPVTHVCARVSVTHHMTPPHQGAWMFQATLWLPLQLLGVVLALANSFRHQVRMLTQPGAVVECLVRATLLMLLQVYTPAQSAALRRAAHCQHC